MRNLSLRSAKTLLPCRREHRFHKIHISIIHLDFKPQLEANTASKNPQEYPEDLKNHLHVDEKSLQEPPESNK